MSNHKHRLSMALDHASGQDLHRKGGKEFDRLQAYWNDTGKPHLLNVFRELFVRWVFNEQKVSGGLGSVPKWKEVLGTEPPGERAQLCMQDMELPHPTARPAPAVVCDYAPGPSAQGLWRQPCVLLPGRWGGHWSLVNLLKIASDD